jgi:hypothetical protein
VPDSLYTTGLRPALSQGDVLKGVRIDEGHLGVPPRTLTVMALSHSCEIDKPHNKVMLVSNVRPLSDFNADTHEGIRDGRNLALFYLPPFPPSVIEESCVDFRQTFRVSFSAIGATDLIALNNDTPPQRVFSGTDPRVQSLSEFGVAALHGRIVAFFTRSRAFE